MMQDVDFLGFVVIPGLIFLARIVDVSIGTVKLILISRGMKIVSAVLSFFEVMIWLMVITHIMQNLDNPLNYLAYAAGFATGTYVGMILEGKIALGRVVLQIITQRDSEDLRSALKEAGFPYTQVNADGNEGPATFTFTVIRRKRLPEALEIINNFNPKAFYSIEDVKHVREEMIKDRRRRSILATLRKGK
ncbi:MAG: DUF2179 domain-containing protein [Candidatus Altiarchaeales archaeon]|nr:DUF2179 domain-containing protein [Candidatus Altiarchaeales archaeon]MBD3417333.1 DUF2179 domain-containing protein [Candidatus Altiarchaeales archaeon]